MENTTKKPFYKKWWVWVGGVVVLFILIGAAGGSSSPTPTDSSAAADKVESGAQKQYQEVLTFKGNGAKKSEPFTIEGDRFKISYECTGDPSGTYCGAFVYKVGSSFPQAVMNSPQAVKDETIIYTKVAGKGEYYIDANVLGSFTMVVSDYK